MIMRALVTRVLLRLTKDRERRFPRLAMTALGATLLAGGMAAAQQAAPVKPGNIFQQKAVQLGASRCANVFAALGEQVALGANHAVQVEANKAAPDAHPLKGLVGMAYDRPEYRAQAAGVVLAAPVGQRCEGQLIRVAPFQQSCQQVVAALPKGSAVASNLSGVPLYNLGGDQGQALLVPSGSACVVVTIAHAVELQ